MQKIYKRKKKNGQVMDEDQKAGFTDEEIENFE